MFAGKSLADMQVALDADANVLPHIVSELEARVARAGKSAPNAQKALDRLAKGESVAIPPKADATGAPKAQADPLAPNALAAAIEAAKAPKTPNPNLPVVAAKAQAIATGPKATEKALWAYAAKALKAGGYPVPRHISKAARTGTLAPKVNA